MSWRTANILDPIHETLDPRVFDDEASARPRLKEAHVRWAKRMIYSVLGEHGYTDVKGWLHLVLTGSLTTYQYSDESDFDMSLFVDVERFPEWSRAEMIGIMVEQVDGQVLPGTPHPVQAFVVPPYVRPADLYKPGLRSGYDLDGERWIVPPERDRVFDVQAQKRDLYLKAVEAADKMDRLLRYDPERAVMYWHQIHNRRREDQRRGLGDFAESNIVYKMLANRGLFPAISEVSGEYIARHVAQHGNSKVAAEEEDLPEPAWRQFFPEGPDVPWHQDPGRTELQVPFREGDRVWVNTRDEDGNLAESFWGTYVRPDPRYTGSHYVQEDGKSYTSWVMGDWIEPVGVPGVVPHPDPWMDNEPGGTTFPVEWGKQGDWDPRSWLREQHDDPNLVTTPSRLVGMPWVPGYHGKALQDEAGNLITWNVSERDGNPHHWEIAQTLPRGNYFNPIRIMPDGSIDPERVIDPSEFSPVLYDKIFEDEPRIRYSPPITLDPRANPDPSFGGWKLGRGDWTEYYREVEEQPEPEITPWGPGSPGKCFMGDGQVYSWKTDAPADKPSVGVPHHTWVKNQLGLDDMRGSGWIYPDGRIHFPYLDSEPTTEETLEAVVEAIPGTRRWEPRQATVKESIGDPRRTIVRKWVYNGDTDEVIVGEEGPEEGEQPSHAQLADLVGVEADTPWVGGTISRSGWANFEVGRDRGRVRAPAQEALRRAVPDIEGFLGGEATWVV